MKIDDKLIEEYQENGAVCLRNVFSREWLELAAQGIEKNIASPSPLGEKLKGDKSDAYYFDDLCNWRRFPEIKKYALESPAAAIAGQLMKSEYASFYHEQILVKEPGAEKETPWHHDQAYYPIDGNKVCSIWMPIDVVPKDTCVQYVAGSHKWGWYYPRKFETTLPYKVLNNENFDRVFEHVPDIDANRDQYKLLHWDLQPGDCIVFHMRTLHGAPGNASTTRRRRAIATRWLGEDAVLVNRPWEHSPPTLGGLKFGDRAVSDEFPIVWRRDS